MSRLSEQIRSARLQAGISEKDLAKKCGLSVSYVIQIESGKKVVNEAMGEKLLAALGQEMEFIKLQEEPVDQVPTRRPSLPEAPIQIKPNDQWTDALRGVLRTYPVLRGQVTVGETSVPIIDKKIKGFRPEELTFIELEDNHLVNQGLFKGDWIMVGLTDKVANGKLHLVEIGSKRLLGYLRQEKNKTYHFSSSPNATEANAYPPHTLKILGHALRLERQLL